MQGFAFVVRADFATGPLPHGRVQPKGRSGLLEGLTFAFGMGTGVAPPAMPPGIDTRENLLGRGGRRPSCSSAGFVKQVRSGCGATRALSLFDRCLENKVSLLHGGKGQ